MFTCLQAPVCHVKFCTAIKDVDCKLFLTVLGLHGCSLVDVIIANSCMCYVVLDQNKWFATTVQSVEHYKLICFSFCLKPFEERSAPLTFLFQLPFSSLLLIYPRANSVNPICKCIIQCRIELKLCGFWMSVKWEKLYCLHIIYILVQMEICHIKHRRTWTSNFQMGSAKCSPTAILLKNLERAPQWDRRRTAHISVHSLIGPWKSAEPTIRIELQLGQI